jgi:hypothetical protein
MGYLSHISDIVIKAFRPQASGVARFELYCFNARADGTASLQWLTETSCLCPWFRVAAMDNLVYFLLFTFPICFYILSLFACGPSPHPQKDVTDILQKDITNIPRKDITNTPQKDVTNIPQEDVTNIPRKDVTDVPLGDKDHLECGCCFSPTPFVCFPN